MIQPSIREPGLCARRLPCRVCGVFRCDLCALCGRDWGAGGGDERLLRRWALRLGLAEAGPGSCDLAKLCGSHFVASVVLAFQVRQDGLQCGQHLVFGLLPGVHRLPREAREGRFVGGEVCAVSGPVCDREGQDGAVGCAAAGCEAWGVDDQPPWEGIERRAHSSLPLPRARERVGGVARGLPDPIIFCPHENDTPMG